jgi:formylglycine-generating enzyme required for sulfatase activity
MKRAATVFLLVFALAVGSLAVGNARITGAAAAGQAPEQDRRLTRDPSAPTSSEKRTALVIGNKNYKVGGLRNPINDAKAMAAALRDPAVGFEVEEKFDATLVEMKRAIRDFGTKLRASGGVGLFYYAGHGIQVNGRNYLVPLGAEGELEKESDVDIFCLDAETVLRQMEDAGAGVNIVILDACRDNPFARSFRRSGSGGLAEMAAPSGSFIAYAADPGKTASDGEADNGLFTSALLEKLKEPGLRIEDVFNLAGADVERKSQGRQQPWISSKLRGAFYFRPPVAGSPATDPETEAWNDIRNSSRPADFKAFLKEFPNGKFAGTARLRIARLETGVAPGPAGIEFVDIPAGEFTMGVDHGPYQKDLPPHRVVIPEPFRIGKFEVTQAQWQAVMGSNPSKFNNCADCPVESVMWDEVQEFLRRLNRRGDGFTYALPTEAEWEYACRAGTTGDFYAEPLEDIGWFKSNADERPHPVGGKKPNAWGLYDMHGNVWEFCAEAVGESPPFPNVRGGAWFHGPATGAAWFPLPAARTGRAAYIGFRITARPSSAAGTGESSTKVLSGIIRNRTPFRNEAGLDFVPIPAGEFRMGEAEEYAQSFEKPAHRVVISRPFWIGRCEVTQEVWAGMMGSNPSVHRDCPKCPVDGVSWEDAAEFIRRLNARNDGFVYGLPTEAEWEYAARAGTNDGYLGEALGPFAWYTATEAEIGRGTTHPVGEKKANPWGLHDVFGNVWEWCADRFDENYYKTGPATDPPGPETGTTRVLRGGSFQYNAFGCRAAMRFWLEPSRRERDVGLRLTARPAKP